MVYPVTKKKVQNTLKEKTKQKQGTNQPKKQTKHSLKRMQTLKSDSVMAGMLELPKQEFILF